MAISTTVLDRDLAEHVPLERGLPVPHALAHELAWRSSSSAAIAVRWRRVGG